MKILLQKAVCLLALAGLISSCNTKSKGEESSLVKTISLIDTVKIDDVKNNYAYFLKNVMQLPQSEIDSSLSKLKYDVVFSKVEYEAVDVFGNKKTLSGLVGYPILLDNDSDKKLNIVSVQHGTLSFESDAPSGYTYSDPSTPNDLLSYVSASHEGGYIVVMPDYFGYGSDEKGLHFYEVRSSLAEASRKLIEATPDFAKQRSLNVDYNKLYLFGYSEGGFATMSTLKSLSETDSLFQDYVTVAGAGAYDKLATATRVVEQTTGDSPTFVASYLWVMLTYNKVYAIDRSLDKLLQPKLTSEVQKYEDTDLIMQIKDIPSVPIEVFNPDFVAGIASRTDKQFIDALNDNNASDFEAKGRIDLVHGDADTWVPTFNTDSAYLRLQKRGVTVDKVIIPGGTHRTAYPPFIIKAIEKL